MKNFLVLTTLKFLVLFIFLPSLASFATGEPSTRFNIFIPPNAEAIRRDVCLIVTAIEDSTQFSIIDDGMDGDTDDSKSGMLMAGQSYVLYIRDNGINDDARYASGGTLKQDGDYFIITSNKLIYASQSTNSDWQHDWLPAVSKSGIGQKFIVYSPQPSSSKRDVNIFAYQDNTNITIRKISTVSTVTSGYTNVDIYSTNIVVQRNLNIGQDLIYSGTEGRDLMENGATYVIESNKPVTVQYGALYGNERDGGGYVPASSGKSSGELFYFAIPFQSGTTGEQEIRIVSADNNNDVRLERFTAGNWITMKNWTLQTNSPIDWVGKNNGNVNYPTVFRITCTPGKKVLVFEANWMETGSVGTSDMATMCSSIDGTSAGKDFIAYLCPPGNEYNVKDPFTNQLFNKQLTHLYLFASKDTCHVTVKDAYTNGAKFTRNFTILPERYADCSLTLAEWKSIYNSTGTIAGGPERPYLKIDSDNNISVMNTNFNDNWMMYFGSSLGQSFIQNTTTTKELVVPGDTAVIISSVIFKASSVIENPTLQLIVASGASVISSSFIDVTNADTISGNVSVTNTGTKINYDLTSSLFPTHDYQVQTSLVPQVMYNDGTILLNNTVIGVETYLGGSIDGTYQQSSSYQGLTIQSSNTSNLMFTMENFNSDLTNSWTANITDLNQDGYEDIFVADKSKNTTNLFYLNNGNRTFLKTTIPNLTTTSASTVCASWADFNNDGNSDVLIVNNTEKLNKLIQNEGGLSFHDLSAEAVSSKAGYYHSGSFADYDNDGYVDIFICNFMPTRFNELYHNNGNGTFSNVTNDPVVSESFMSIGATWADFDNDGDQDLFVPNGNGENNSFFVNNGHGKFVKELNSIIVNDGGNSVGSCWGDINNDGWLDLFVANASNQNNFLYINQNGIFSKVVSGSVVTDGGHSHGCSFADTDNDMDLDLYVTNDQGKKFFYINDGNGNFTRKSDEIIESNFGKSMGNYWFDADRDGDLDLFVVTHSNQKNYFFSNNGNDNHWIDLKLIGNISNKDAIGARVRVKTGGIWQIREINSQSGIGGQTSIRNHFGLANNAMIDSIIINWPSGYEQVLTDLPVNSFQTVTEPQGATVNGIVYNDKNNNCHRDLNEPLITGIRVDFSTGSYALSNKQGSFSLPIRQGTYNVSISPQQHWNTTCAFSDIHVQSLADTVMLELPIHAVSDVQDLKVYFSASPMRRGFNNNVFIGIENKGTVTSYNIPLKLTLISGMNITAASPNYQSVDAQVYNWIIDSITPGENLSINLQAYVNLTKAIGNTLTFKLEAVLQGDIAPSDNSLYSETTVVGAIDPNDMMVSPVGEGLVGYIKKGTVLNYKIRFQNIGSYSASNIRIYDQLPAGLDFSKVRLEMASHNCNFSISNSGNITIEFPDIELPDSTADPINSNGFVTFSAPLINDINEGFILKNRASINFDFEDAISTNEVMNTVVMDSPNEEIIIYPNPSSGTFKFKIISNGEEYQSGNIIKSVNMFNGQGVLVKKFQTSEWTGMIDMIGYTEGIYYFVITDINNRNYRCKLILAR